VTRKKGENKNRGQKYSHKRDKRRGNERQTDTHNTRTHAPTQPKTENSKKENNTERLTAKRGWARAGGTPCITHRRRKKKKKVSVTREKRGRGKNAPHSLCFVFHPSPYVHHPHTHPLSATEEMETKKEAAQLLW
jgi:hypothetical protein